jgi:hypothetical protein
MNSPNDADAIAQKRRQLAAIAAKLTAFRARLDVLMSAFKFEAAQALQVRIELTEREHRELEAELPPLPVSARPPTPYQVAGRRRRR